MSKGMTAEETIIAAWRMAVSNRPIKQELIFHSDRGIQYACTKFTNILNVNKLVQRSMTRKGNCWDNAVAESFFSSLKKERIKKQIYKNRELALADVADYIETFYNQTRRHSYLGGVSLDQFEAAHRPRRQGIH